MPERQHPLRLEPDLKQTYLFLRRLDPDAAGQQFMAIEDGVPKPRVHTFPFAPLSKLEAELTRWNNRGYGIFGTINETDGSGTRAGKNIIRVRAVWYDYDNKAPEGHVRRPHPNEEHFRLASDSSPGKEHGYFFLKDGMPLEGFKPSMQDLIARYGSDPSIHDLPRVMRMPGFWHLKDPANPGMTRIIHMRDDQTRYPVSDFLVEARKRQPRPQPEHQEPREGKAPKIDPDPGQVNAEGKVIVNRHQWMMRLVGAEMLFDPKRPTPVIADAVMEIFDETVVPDDGANANREVAERMIEYTRDNKEWRGASSINGQIHYGVKPDAPLPPALPPAEAYAAVVDAVRSATAYFGTAAPVPMTEEESEAEMREYLAAVKRGDFDGCEMVEAPIPLMAVGATPGTGKSTEMLKAAAEANTIRAATFEGERIVTHYHVPTIKLARELKAKAPAEAVAQIIQGRIYGWDKEGETPLCQRWAEVKEAQEAGVQNISGHFCKQWTDNGLTGKDRRFLGVTYCKHYSKCGYQDQFKKLYAATLIYMMLGHRRDRRIPEPDLIVVDENPAAVFLPKERIVKLAELLAHEHGRIIVDDFRAGSKNPIPALKAQGFTQRDLRKYATAR